MPTGMKYSFRLVDQNNRKVCVQFVDGNWTLITRTLGNTGPDGKEWTEVVDRLSAEDLGAMNFQMLRLFGAGPAPQDDSPIVK